MPAAQASTLAQPRHGQARNHQLCKIIAAHQCGLTRLHGAGDPSAQGGRECAQLLLQRPGLRHLFRRWHTQGSHFSASSGSRILWLWTLTADGADVSRSVSAGRVCQLVPAAHTRVDLGQGRCQHVLIPAWC